MTQTRDIDLDLTVKPIGKAGMLMAFTGQMPSLIVTGIDESDLWDCIGPVFTSLVQASGDRVQLLTLDRSGPADHIRIRAQVLSPAADTGLHPSTQAR